MKHEVSAAQGRSSEPARRAGGSRWRVFGVLMLAALVGALALLPYQTALLGPAAAQRGQTAGLLLVAGVVQILVIAAIATGLGLWLGPAVGLGAPLLRGCLAGDSRARSAIGASLPLAVGAGVLIGLVVVGLDALVFAPALPELRGIAATRPSWWQGLLAALYGGTVEEIDLRLGVMTVLIWLGAALARARPPATWVYWAGNLLAAVAFGAGHLPAMALLVPLTPFLVARTLVLNALPGLVFGWLYWRRGLLAAMAAHFAGDVVLHAVLGPLLSGGV